jgi:hypothetical protein
LNECSVWNFYLHMMRSIINLLPDKANESIKIMLSKLNISTEPVIVDIVAEPDAEYGNCFVNVLNRVKRNGGAVVHGWQFCEYPYMIEAEFHAVWKSPYACLLDITPSIDPNAKQILFVADKSRSFQGEPVDNARLNTTTNELVDDIIRIEEARFRFLNTDERKHILGEVPLNEKDASIWQAINLYAEILEQMYFSGFGIHSTCFCNAGLSYSNCHRRGFNQLILSIR